MSNIASLIVDVVNHSVQLNDYPVISLPKCKGLEILNFLNQHIDQQFPPTLLRMNIENNQSVEPLQYDELSILIDQACDYIPMTDRLTIRSVVSELQKNTVALEEAKANHNIAEVDYLLEQNEMLSEYLNQTLNFNHTIRNINQARINDSRSIKRALNKLLEFIASQNPKVAKIIKEHLIINSSHVGLVTHTSSSLKMNFKKV